MKTILTVNGRQYSVQAPPGRVLGPADIEQAKQNILSGNIQKLNPATCIDVVKGTSHDVKLTATGGVANFTYRLLLDETQIATAGPIADTSYTFNYKFDQAIGEYILTGTITDSCSTPQISTDSCTTFNIIAPPGSISCITTPPGASVTLDGVSQEVVTPVTLTDVSAGSHIVNFTLAGYTICPVTVDVTAGSTVSASCTLCAIPGCDFTWSPTSPVLGDTVVVTATDTSLTADGHDWYWGESLLQNHTSSFSMKLTLPQLIGDHIVTHDAVNSCGSNCSKQKTITVACSVLGITMNIV